MGDDSDPTVREGAKPRSRPVDNTGEGRYRPIREIARGGMGRVIEALDTELQRTVALKEILDDDLEARARFDREVAITARLEHPSIVPLYDAGRTPSGAPFYVMRKVAGEPLDALIRNADTLDQRLRLLPHVLALADAVAHAHARGVIHRDIKPSNVLVGELGETVVIDWGLAKLIGETDEAMPARDAGDSLHTRAGTVFGTPGFMPPEQLRGDPVDERADVYALGGCLYHVLAGERPTDGMSRFDVAGAPPDLVTIVKKAMAADKTSRYLDAGGFSEDLRRFLGGQLVAAHDYPLHTRLARWLRRHRAVVAVTLLAVVLAIAGGVWSLQRILAEQTRAEDALTREQLRADDLLLFKASAFAETNPTLAVATLMQLRPDSPRWDSIGPMLFGIRARGVAYGYPGLANQIRHVEQSPTDERILVSAVGSAALIDPIARTSRVISTKRELTQASWWRGKVVLYGRREDQLLDLATSATGPVPWPDDAHSVQLADNGSAFYLDTSPTVYALDPADRRISLAVAEPPRALEIEPTGTFVAVRWTNRLQLLRMADGRLETILSVDGSDPRVAFGPARVAITAGGTITEYDLAKSPPAETRRWPHEPRGVLMYVAGKLHSWEINQVRQFDEQGSFIAGRTHGFSPEATTRGNRMARVVDPKTIELYGGRIRNVLHAPESLHLLAARPDRRFIVAAGARVMVWDLDELATARSEVPLVDGIAFEAEDRLLGLRFHSQQIVHHLQIRPSLAVEPTSTQRFSPDLQISAFGQVRIVYGFDPINHRAAVLGSSTVPIALTDLTDVHVLDERSLVAATRDGTVHRVDLATGRAVEKLGSVDFPVALIGGRNGWIIAAASDGRLWRRDPQGAITTANLPRWVTPLITDDGTVFLGRDNELYEWATDREPIRIAAMVRPVKYLRYSTGRVLILSTSDGTLYRVDRMLRIPLPLLGNATQMVVSGGTIAVLANDRLVIADVATGITYAIVESGRITQNGIAVSPDGKLVACITPHGEATSAINVWRLESVTRSWVMTATNAIAPDEIDGAVNWRP